MGKTYVLVHGLLNNGSVMLVHRRSDDCLVHRLLHYLRHLSFTLSCVTTAYLSDDGLLNRSSVDHRLCHSRYSYCSHCAIRVAEASEATEELAL